MSLDVRTLYFVVGISCFFVSGAFLFFQARQFHTDGVKEWSTGYAFQGIYWILLGLRDMIPDVLSIVVANPFLTAGYSLLYAAVREFQDRPYRRDLLFFPVIVTTLVISFFWVYRDDIFLRTVYISLLSGIQMASIAVILFREVPFHARRSQWLTGCLFVIGAILWLIRLLELLLSPHHQPQTLGPSYVRTILLLLGFGNVVLTSIGFLLMIRERAGEVLQKAYQELQKTKDQLVQSEKLSALGRLAAGAAHEIRNPLNIMSLWIQILEKTETLTEKTREAFGSINVQIARIVKIIDGLRTFSSLPAGEKTQRDIHQVIDHVLRSTATRIQTEHVSVETAFQAGLPWVSLDVKRMEQALLHILNNALDAVKNQEERKIGIRTSLVPGDSGAPLIRIAISDTGHGIKGEDLLRLFDPFFTTKGPDKGTGLGLSIAYSIIQDHGGRIWAENNEEGGASFFIELPVGEGPAPGSEYPS